MLRSQKPELLEAYHQIVSEFHDLPNGIYDTTPDVDRSAALADAYLGDGSSVMQLFAVLGKPIFYNDLLLGQPVGDDVRHLVTGRMLIDRGTMYFCEPYLNLLCQRDMQTGKVDILCELPVFFYKTSSFGAMVKIKDRLILIPANAACVGDYDLQTGELRQIPLAAPRKGGNFSNAEVLGDKVFMIGCRYPAILIYDVLQRTVRYETDCFQDLLSDRSGRHEEMLGRPCRVQDRLYIPVLQSNRILEYSLLDGSYVLHTVGPDGAGYGIATEYDGAIWLTPWRGGPIARWMPATGEFKLIDQFPKGFAAGKLPGSDEMVFFSDAVRIGRFWWLLPYQSNLLMRLDLRDGRLESIPLDFELTARSSDYFNQLCNVWCGAEWQGKLLIWCGYDRNIRVLNPVAGHVEAVWPVMLSKKDFLLRKQRPLTQSDFEWIPQEGVYAVQEDGLRSTIENFCTYVAAGRHDREAQRRLFEPMAEHADGTCGVHVHEYIMQCLREKRE